MKFIDQTKLHNPEKGVMGNCLAAAIASVLGLTLDEVPEFEEMSGGEYFVELVAFPATLGKRLVYHPRTHPPKGLSVGTVNSPRFPDERHAIVCLDGKVVHDPHPTRASINPEIIWYYETFVSAYDNNLTTTNTIMCDKCSNQKMENSSHDQPYNVPYCTKGKWSGGCDDMPEEDPWKDCEHFSKK